MSEPALIPREEYHFKGRIAPWLIEDPVVSQPFGTPAPDCLKVVNLMFRGSKFEEFVDSYYNRRIITHFSSNISRLAHSKLATFVLLFGIA